MISNALLDTHAWLWIMAGEGKISSKIISFLENIRERNALYLSDISLWEISMLAKKNRITLGQPTLAWIKNALKLSNIHLVHLTPEIVVESTELPGIFHGGPADRLIIATARIMNLTVLTRDEKILEYGRLKYLQTLSI